MDTPSLDITVKNIGSALRFMLQIDQNFIAFSRISDESGLYFF